jgi:nitroreductase
MPFKTIAKIRAKRKEDAGSKSVKKSVFDLVMENIMTRRSVRKFKKNDVPDDVLFNLIDAARHAPSAANKQPWAFIIVRDPKVKALLAGAAEGQDWIADAPVIIVACMDVKLAGARFGERGVKLYGIQNVAAAVENLMLAANALGLGTCWVGAFSEPKVAGPLRCPEHVRPCALIPVGWPDEAPEPPVRHELSDFVHLGAYGRTPRAHFAWGHPHAGD